MRRLSSWAGLTLMETVVAMCILAITLAGLLSAFMMNQRIVVCAGNLEKSTHRARGIMEGLMSRPYYDSSLTVGTHAIDATSAYGVTEKAGVKTISVTVNWSNAMQKSVSTLPRVSGLCAAIHD